MFFKSDIKQKDDRDYRYYRLCESYCEGRHIRNRTLLAVGDLESLLAADRIPLLAKRVNQVYHEGKASMISFLRDNRELCTEYVNRLREAEKQERQMKKASGIEEVYLERTTHSGVREVGFDPGEITRDRLYAMAHRLYRDRDGLGYHFSNRTSDLFSLDDSIILYDLTNTYFEDRMQESALARFCRSKEKCNDARLVVVMDAGIATQENLKMLGESSFDYVCVSRGKLKNYRATGDSPVRLEDNRGKAIDIARVEVEGETDSFYRVKSHGKALKEASMENRFTRAFECALEQIASALTKKGGTKKLEKVWERVGRLKQKYGSVNRLYDIQVVPDGKGIYATSLTWRRTGTQSVESHGEYFVRTSLPDREEETLWKIYNTIREVEATFRCLKSDLSLRPVFHKTDEATMAHLHLGLLAYQLVSTIRFQLKRIGITHEWKEIVRIMNTQKMVTTNLVNTDEEHISIRKCSSPEPKAQAIYKALHYEQKPFIRKKSVVLQMKIEKNKKAEKQDFNST